MQKEHLKSIENLAAQKIAAINALTKDKAADSTISDLIKKQEDLERRLEATQQSLEKYGSRCES